MFFNIFCVTVIVLAFISISFLISFFICIYFMMMMALCLRVDHSESNFILLRAFLEDSCDLVTHKKTTLILD